MYVSGCGGGGLLCQNEHHFKILKCEDFDDIKITKPCYELNLILTLFKHQTKSMLFRIKFTLVLVDGSITLFVNNL